MFQNSTSRDMIAGRCFSWKNMFGPCTWQLGRQRKFRGPFSCLTVLPYGHKVRHVWMMQPRPDWVDSHRAQVHWIVSLVFFIPGKVTSICSMQKRKKIISCVMEMFDRIALNAMHNICSICIFTSIFVQHCNLLSHMWKDRLLDDRVITTI